MWLGCTTVGTAIVRAFWGASEIRTALAVAIVPAVGLTAMLLRWESGEPFSACLYPALCGFAGFMFGWAVSGAISQAVSLAWSASSG
jgi:hypothetical protein